MVSITNTTYSERSATTGCFPETIPSTFCNKNYKFIRVAADSTSRLCLALFYQIISCCYGIVGSPTSHHYKSLAGYQCKKAENLLAYLRFGKEVIDFSVNSSNKVKNPLPSTITEEQALRSIYEDLDVDQWMEIGKKNILLDKNRLCRLEINGGCCSGMSFDFISRYLKDPNKLEALASVYTDGAPNKAQLAQIFYKALDPSTESKEKLDALWKDYKKKNKELTQLLEIKKEELKKLPSVEQKKIINELETLVLDHLSNNNNEIDKKLLQISLKESLERTQFVANFFNLTIDKDRDFVYVLKKDQNITFEAFANDLPNGIYYVGTSTHAMVYIKREAKHLIYDPNFATLAVDPKDSAARLWGMARMYLKERADYIRFSPCSLS